jgi:hypothetical protein
VISFVLSSGDEYTVEGLGLYMSGIVWNIAFLVYFHLIHNWMKWESLWELYFFKINTGLYSQKFLYSKRTHQ